MFNVNSYEQFIDNSYLRFYIESNLIYKEVNLPDLDDKSLIIKSNKIIEARYKLNAIETKIIMILISLINRDDSDFKGYKLKVKDVANLIGLKSTNKYSRLKEITRRLVRKELEIQEDDGLLQVSWLSSTKYYDNEGLIKFSFDPLLKPYLLELKGNFTSYLLRNILSLDNEHSPRIYALLKQYESIGKRNIAIKELRVILGIKDSQYKLYGDFKRYVLKVSQKDIERNTDIKFDFKEAKTGRKVTSIIFLIHPNVKAIEQNNKKLLDDLKYLGLKNKDINSILKDHKTEVVQQVLDNYYAQTEEKLKQIENPAGFFLSMLPDSGEAIQPSKAYLKKKKTEKNLEIKETEMEKKHLLDNLFNEFLDIRDKKREKAIKNISDDELAMLKDEFLEETSDFIRGQAKFGFDRQCVQSPFKSFLNKKFLEPDEMDFIKFGEKKGYKIKKNSYNEYVLI